MSPQFLISTACAAVLLSGCGSSSSTPYDGLQEDQIGTDITANPGAETDIDLSAETNSSVDTENNSGTDTEIDSSTENNSGTDTEIDSSTENNSGTDTEIELSTETDSSIDTGIDLGTETDSSTDTETGSSVDTETDSSIDTETDSGIDTETDSSIDTETDSGVDTETDSSVDTEIDSSIDTEETGSDIDTETDSSVDTEIDSNTDTETNSSTDTDSGIDTETEIDSSTDTDTDSSTDIGADTESSPTNLNDMLVPNVAAGSDLERLISGVNRQVSMTLLELNQQISQGEELTRQQEICLGAFDPAVGEQLLAIDCEQALATGDVSVYVSQAAFYDTEDCHASLFNGNTDNCQLQRAGMTLSDKFGVSEGERRPRLIYAGRVLSYALTDTMLQVENSPTTLDGVFSCDIDLASGNSSVPLVGTSCTGIVMSTANYLDDVLPQ